MHRLPSPERNAPTTSTRTVSTTPGRRASLKAAKKSRVTPFPLPKITLFTVWYSAAQAGRIVTSGRQQSTQYRLTMIMLAIFTIKTMTGLL